MSQEVGSHGERSAEEVRRVVDSVLDRSELDDSPSLLQKVLTWIVEHLLPDAGPEVESAVEGLIYVIGTVLVVLLLVLLGRLIWQRFKRKRPVDTVEELVRTRVAELRGLAREARHAGDLPLALRFLLCALVVGLGQRGDLRYRDSWTNRELLERGKPKPRVRTLLRPLIDELEAKEFGNEPVTAGDVDRLQQLCRQWLGKEDAR